MENAKVPKPTICVSRVLHCVPTEGMANFSDTRAHNIPMLRRGGITIHELLRKRQGRHSRNRGSRRFKNLDGHKAKAAALLAGRETIGEIRKKSTCAVEGGYKT